MRRRRGRGCSVSSGASEAPVLVDAPADEAMPWHDAALSMDERMKLAEGKPPARRLMAAMAQLDCGACGYVCQTYAEAIANGEEKDLSRCAPGGRETSKKLKELVAAVPPDKVTVNGTPRKAKPKTAPLNAP